MRGNSQGDFLGLTDCMNGIQFLLQVKSYDKAADVTIHVVHKQGDCGVKHTSREKERDREMERGLHCIQLQTLSVQCLPELTENQEPDSARESG